MSETIWNDPVALQPYYERLVQIRELLLSTINSVIDEKVEWIDVNSAFTGTIKRTNKGLYLEMAPTSSWFWTPFGGLKMFDSSRTNWGSTRKIEQKFIETLKCEASAPTQLFLDYRDRPIEPDPDSKWYRLLDEGEGYTHAMKGPTFDQDKAILKVVSKGDKTFRYF